MSQYVAFFQNSRVAYGDGETGHWAHLFGMLRVAGLDVASPVQQFVRIIAGLATLGTSWIVVRKLSPEHACFYLYAI